MFIRFVFMSVEMVAKESNKDFNRNVDEMLIVSINSRNSNRFIDLFTSSVTQQFTCFDISQHLAKLLDQEMEKLISWRFSSGNGILGSSSFNVPSEFSVLLVCALSVLDGRDHSSPLLLFLVALNNVWPFTISIYLHSLFLSAALSFNMFSGCQILQSFFPHYVS